MKKLTTIFMLFMAVAMITSCGKEEKTVQELLTSGKWYYKTFKNTHTSSVNNCFDANHYWEFKTNGDCEETNYIDVSGTYTISADGKTITFTLEHDTFTLSNVVIDENSFKFNIDIDGGTFEVELSKTAGDCAR